MKDANMVEELMKILGKSTGTSTNDSQPDQAAEPWGPQGDGEWVEIPEGGVTAIGFPAWVRTLGESMPRLAKQEDGTLELHYKDGRCPYKVGNESYLEGEYVWVPKVTGAPKPNAAWGPSGDGKWVNITSENLGDMVYPYWLRTPCKDSHIIYRVERAGGSVVQFTDCTGYSCIRHDFATRGDEAWISALPEKPLLQVAQEIINGPRRDDYGPAHINLGRVAALWSELLGFSITIEDVAMMMILFKVSRSKHNPKRYDSWVDIAGYAGLVDKAWRGE